MSIARSEYHLFQEDDIFVTNQGIEWNIPHHHRVSTFMPVDYELTENSDGSKTIWVGEYEKRHGTRWIVGLTTAGTVKIQG
ncbi:MAG: DUF5107 domain-containing protein [Bacteroidetes bacterium]|nr:DUF5107 domain-containing protein [Bacteroidota bacterium]